MKKISKVAIAGCFIFVGIFNKPIPVKAVGQGCECVSVSVTTNDGCYNLGCFSNQGAQDVMNRYPAGTYFNIAKVSCSSSGSVSGLKFEY